MSIRRAVLAAAVVATLTACGSDGGDAVVTPPAPAPVANIAPVANAGSAQSVVAGVSAVVTLDGSASSDANSDALTYVWTLTEKPTGSAAVLANPTSPKPTFVADMAGTYVASLLVNDGRTNSTASTVTVTAAVANAAPVANAGTAQSVMTGATVTLDGSASSDANGDALTYTWTLASRPAGSTAALAGANMARPTFVPDVAGAYVATLAVNDGRLDSAASIVVVTAAVANAAPMANAGSAQTVITGATVALNGSASSDANADLLTYAWTLTGKPAGSTAALVGATTVNPTFVADVSGTYVATLVVNDGKAASAGSTVAITADTVTAYDSIETLPYNMPSLGAEAYGFVSLGERVVLKSGAPRTLHAITVAMSSWACESGAWHLGTCSTTEGATFDHPITLRVYDVSGNLLATVTRTFALPYRPSADPTCADVKQWKAADGLCYNGKATTIQFDLRSLNVQLAHDVFTFNVSYNTAHRGPSPLGVGGPYDSLNIGLAKIPPAVGVDFDPGYVLWDGVLDQVDTTVPYSIMSKVIVGAP